MAIGIKPILPKNPIFKRAQFDRDVVKTLNDVREGIKKDFESTVATWRNKPVFQGKKATITSPVSQIWGNKNTWVWVVGGTKPHTIVPRRARLLRFQTGYRRKTTVGKLGSRTGGPFGNTVFARAVRHPGNKPGKQDKAAADKWQPILVKKYRKDVDNATNN